jgi:hypothetical protein
MERNEVVFHICQMVWAEVVLKNKADWCIIKQAKNIMMPEEKDIPTGVLRFPHGGLNLSKGPISKEEVEDDKRGVRGRQQLRRDPSNQSDYIAGAQEGSQGVA